MKNNIAYKVVENITIPDIKPAKSKHYCRKLRVAQFDKDGKFLICYESAKDASIAIAKEKKQITVKVFILELLNVVI
jgi:hypothetical protein